MKRLRFSMALLTFIWCLNQVGSVVILLYYFSSATTELYFQVFGMFTATSIFAYQLVSLLKAMKRLESQNRNMMKFADERRSITLQFLTFALGFLVKAIFNMVLVLTSYSLNENTD